MVSKRKKKQGRPFDDWPERYDRWFETPMGALVKKYECELLLEMLRPEKGERILDAGCGTGVFTFDILPFVSHVTGIDISLPMVRRACRKGGKTSFNGLAGDMMSLPFADGAFDKVVSVTALEFVRDARRAVKELFRVTRRGGVIVVTTLNRLSPWADRRTRDAKRGDSIFETAIFRSPDEMRSLASSKAVVRTAVHFRKEDAPEKGSEIEREGRKRGLMTGAFLAVRWEKP